MNNKETQKVLTIFKTLLLILLLFIIYMIIGCMTFVLLALQQVHKLKKEIEILKKLTHENIVKLYYAEDTCDALSIFMEYVPNVSIICTCGS